MGELPLTGRPRFVVARARRGAGLVRFAAACAGLVGAGFVGTTAGFAVSALAGATGDSDRVGAAAGLTGFLAGAATAGAG